MANKKIWFISHPTGGPQHTPTFFSAVNQFAAANAKAVKVILPHEVQEQVQLTKDDINAADLILAEVSIASTGSGIELGWANANNKPVIAFHQSTSPISPSIQFVATAIHAYLTEEHITKVLETLL
ncbi:MAG: hypothetical protein U1C56_02005 [Candidatus Curtissbacteria bacterium]|nr:hypothetical protein [bacterium]MDZ4209931.1 hypothetical protein [Candidatus Curtissbacteria bacterium]